MGEEGGWLVKGTEGRNGRREGRREGGGGSEREGKRVKDDKEGKEGRERITPTTYMCSALNSIN